MPNASTGITAIATALAFDADRQFVTNRLLRPLASPVRVRMCANRVVAGGRIRSRLRSFRLASAHQITSARDFDKLEGLAPARA